MAVRLMGKPDQHSHPMYNYVHSHSHLINNYVHVAKFLDSLRESYSQLKVGLKGGMIHTPFDLTLREFCEFGYCT